MVLRMARLRKRRCGTKQKFLLQVRADVTKNVKGLGAHRGNTHERDQSDDCHHNGILGDGLAALVIEKRVEPGADSSFPCAKHHFFHFQRAA